VALAKDWLRISDGISNSARNVQQGLHRLPSSAPSDCARYVGLGNPFADAIEPALRIPVNRGYTDVLAPGDINTCATGCTGATPQSWGQLGYQAYDRTFGALSVAGDVANGGTATPFGSVAPLTPEGRRAVPGDVWNALIAGSQTGPGGVVGAGVNAR